MVDSNELLAVSDSVASGPSATVVTGVPEDAVPALFARASTEGIAMALSELHAQTAALAATPPLGLSGLLAPARPAQLVEHATFHVAIEGVSLLAARALRDSRFVSSLRPSAVTATDAIIEPPAALAASRTKVREAASALHRARRVILDRIADKLAPRDRAAADVAAREITLGLAPAAARTSVYLSANARVLAGHCEKLLSSPQAEVAAAGRAMFDALRSAAPGLLPDAQRSKLRSTAPAHIESAVARLCSPPEENASATMVISQPVRLVRYDKDALERVALALAYEGSDPRIHAFALSSSLRAAKEPALLEMLKAILTDRAPGELVPRGFEASTLTFEVMIDAATAQDLLRHRVRTVSEQRLSCRLGFHTPDLLIDLGLADLYQDAMLAAQTAWAELDADDALAAEYVVPLGFRVRSLWTLDLRQLVHIVEARSSQDNTMRVRRLAQGLYRTASAVLPWLRDLVRVDLD